MNNPRIGTLTTLCITIIVLAYTQPLLAHDDPETLIKKAFSEIQAQENKRALETLNQLIAQQPDFQLAQLMRADLLYAQANPLEKIGQTIEANLRNDLQAEARARFQALQQPPEGMLPDYVMQLPTWLSHLIMVDLNESRAYLFDIEKEQLTFINSYYLTQGKLGAGKETKGDRRSPIGVYQVIKPIPAPELSTFYGAGALPLDYPNTWDSRNHRNGSGIWLHGAPVGQYSRPPKASDGCMVFSNDHLRQIMAHIDWQRTLVISDSKLKWKRPEKVIAPRESLLRTLENWRTGWEKQEIKHYMNHYAPSFVSNYNEDRSQYEKRKSQLFAQKKAHKIQINDLLLFKYPSEKNLIVSVFMQSCERDGKTTIDKKRIWWQWQNQQWKIINEEIVH
jgi:murein L,D-transpeptidase YafK